MPITKEILEKYKNDIFIETGCHKGEAVDLSLSVGFKKAYTCEINKVKAVGLTKKYGKHEKVEFYHLDSKEFLKKIVPTISDSVTFWLDAHHARPDYNHSGGVTIFNTNIPLLAELEIIKTFLGNRRGNHILIDDIGWFPKTEKDLLKSKVFVLFGKCSFTDEESANSKILACSLI